MVTRVDKKPIVYGSTLARVFRAPAQQGAKDLITSLLKKSVGHKIPGVSARELIDDVEDVNLAFQMMGVDDRMYEYWSMEADEGDDESLNMARLIIDKSTSLKAILKNANLTEAFAKALKSLDQQVEVIYYGTEAVYQFFNYAMKGHVFSNVERPHYTKWAVDTAKRVMVTQSPYMLLHPRAVNDMSNSMGEDINFDVWTAWNLYKKIETIAIRLSSRKGIFAHAFHAGYSRRAFDGDPTVLPDFEVPLTGYAECRDTCKMYTMGGIRYFVVGKALMCFSYDDSINLATMAQCYFRTAMYFTKSNGYKANVMGRVLGIIKDIAEHACRLINNGKNFSNIIRSMHILAQGDFNDAFEKTHGSDLGWTVRSANYAKEAKDLDPMGASFHSRILAIANDDMDKLNVGFIYHVFVGDEMLITDLTQKVAGMTGKVLDADAVEWSRFIAFCKSYLLARYMKTYKRKPKCGGATEQLNDPWAERCVRGVFTMPSQSDWGKVWIQGELTWTPHADHWHLDAQDVSYVPKDSAGLLDGKYREDRNMSSELLMAMTSGDILDTLTGSLPATARKRILDDGPVTEVVLTTAPKAENAKPSWKKRVTFAADCEFRKMQAEYDRNCRKVMSFVRGPSLGLDICTLERQFSDIAKATSLGIVGSVCSHDISAWSESMDRDRKFEFESILINMMSKPKMINIRHDWDKINGVVNKGGHKSVHAIDNASFQGFDGSASTILHALILVYCIDSARRKSIMPTSVKANMATLIDDCVALMVGLDTNKEAVAFWDHLNVTYRRLGFEIDNLKSIFSTIKAIYLSRRFTIGGEVPADFKIFIKAHVSYEDPLRCSVDVVPDIFGAARGACDANGDPWYIYFTSLIHCFSELAHQNPDITKIPPSAAAIYALAPSVENGWGVPSIVDWSTNDVVDKRTHFNCIMESACDHATATHSFQAGVDVFPRPAAKALYTIKAQPWRIVSYSSLFTNPFEAIREGPLKPDMLRRNAVSDILRKIATAEPWKSLLDWNGSATTNIIRELLIDSGPLHAPTLAALVNCMPDSYRLALLGKAIGSSSVLNRMERGGRAVLKRRVMRCASSFFRYTASLYSSTNETYDAPDFACFDHTERTRNEREEFYSTNGIVMIDHTFPDPVGTFTHSSEQLGSVISPNFSSIRKWDQNVETVNRTSQLISVKGIYVPKRSGRVWEATSEYARGWDTISQRIAIGLAIIARAKADGHGVEGLQLYFIKAWNELSNITPDDTHLISIHGSIKRLDSNPGSSTHPIITCRNLLSGFNNRLKSAIDAIPIRSKEMTGNSSHLHDPLAHETCMLTVTALHFSAYRFLGAADASTQFNIATRASSVIPESTIKMDTDKVANRINNEIIDSHTPYGLLQNCPSLGKCIAIPTMRNSWVKMINHLLSGRYAECEALIQEANDCSVDEMMEKIEEEEVYYSSNVVLAEAPASRSSIPYAGYSRYAIHPGESSHRAAGDAYTSSVPPLGSKYSRALSVDQPWHIVCAIGIKSVVWNKLKDRSVLALAKVLYDDPDADLRIVSDCATRDFWRSVVIEAGRGRRNKNLSDVMSSGFRSLGVPDIFLGASNDTGEVSQSVASFFGAHLRDIVKLVSHEILSIAGRHAMDFERPLLERIVTNNPALANASMRKKHMKKLISTNIEMLNGRIDAIENDKIVHAGDARAKRINIAQRLVELRCRRCVYESAAVNEDGSVIINEVQLGKAIADKARSVLRRSSVDAEAMPDDPMTLDDIIQFMGIIEGLLIAAGKLRRSGWDAPSGSIGIRYAADTIYSDSLKVAQTRFAVSACEMAPRIHKRIRTSHAAEPTVQIAENVTILGAGMASLFDEDDDDFMTADQFEAFVPEYGFSLNVAAWQALYTLLHCGALQPEDANECLGCALAPNISYETLREARLSDYTDELLYEKIPTLKAEYLRCGVVFNPDWLDRDEADAYIVDEIVPPSLGALF